MCQQCHTNPPRNSAPFPLVTYDDTQVIASGMPIWTYMRTAVENRVMPLPPVQIDPVDRDTLISWLESGAPASLPSDRCSDPTADSDGATEGEAPDSSDSPDAGDGGLETCTGDAFDADETGDAFDSPADQTPLDAGGGSLEACAPDDDGAFCE